LTSWQLLNLAGFFRVRYHVKLENDPKEIKAVQSCTSLLPMTCIFGLYEYDNHKHGLEICRYWTLSLSEEAERKVDELLATMTQNDKPLSSFAYESPCIHALKEDLPGINVVSCGDCSATTGTHCVPIKHETTALVTGYPEATESAVVPLLLNTSCVCWVSKGCI
jgi:hypothetical protein